MARKRDNKDGEKTDGEKTPPAIPTANSSPQQMNSEEMLQITHELKVHQVELELQNEELRKSQVELERSRSKYTDLFDFAPIGYVVLDQQGLIVEVNLTASAMLGFERKQLRGKPFAGYIRRGSKDEFCLKRRQVMQTGTCVRCEIKLMRQDRREIFADLLMDPVWDHDEQVTQIRVALIDTTQRKQLENEVEDIARFPGENPFPVLRVAVDGTILYSNNPGQVILEYWGCKINQKVPQDWRKLIAHTLESQRYHVEEINCGGKIFSVAIAPMSEDGYVNLYGRDVTAIRQSEAQLRTTLEHLTEGVVVADVDGNVLHWNPAAMAMYGFTSLSQCQRKLADFTDIFELSDDSGAVLPLDQWPLARVLRGETLNDVQIYVKWLNADRQGVFSYSGNLARDKDGKPLMAIISITDITARRAAEDALKWSARRDVLLSETAARFLQSEDPQTMVEDTCFQVMDFLDCQVFFNYRLDKPSNRLHLNACAGIPAQERTNIEWLELGSAVCGCVARDRRRIIAEDIQNTVDPRTVLIKSCGIEAYCCHPLLVQGELIGTLSFGTRTRTRFEPNEVEMMKAVTNLVAIAMHRLQTEQALKESENRFRALVMTSSQVLYQMSPDWAEMRQLQSDTFLANTEKPNRNWLNDYIFPEDQEHIMAVIRDAVTNKTPFEQEHRVRRADGSEGWTFSRAVPLMDADGHIVEWFGAATDITDRKQAEKTLQERETRYRELVQNANSAIIRWKSDGTITFFNEYAQSFFGYPLKDILGRPAGILVPDVDSAGTDLRSLVQDIVSNPEHHTEFVNENICRDGRRVWMAWTNRAIWNEQGQVEEIFAVGIDITARKQAEDALRQSQQRLQMAFDAAYLISFEWDIQRNRVRRFMSKEPALPATEPESFDTLEGVLERVHPEDCQQFIAKINAAMKDPQGRYENEYRTLHPDGQIVWLSERGQVEFDRHGTPIRLIGLTQDITERKKAEQRVQQEYRDTEFVNRILRVFVEDESERLFDKALAVIQEGLASPYGVFGYISEPGHLICPSLSKMLDACEVSGKCIHYPPEKWKGLWARALKEKRSCCTNQAVSVPPGHPPILSNLASPILFQGQVIGLLNLANKEGGYTEQDREILDKIAERIAPVLYAWIQRKLREDERRAAEEALRQSNDELSSFNRMMVGRELRMIELKQELNEVCRKAGLPQRYVMDSGDDLPKMPDEREHSQVEDWNKA